MKAILEFDLPEEAPEHQIALDGVRYCAALEEFRNWLRGQIKYAELSKEEYTFAEKARTEFHRIAGTLLDA